MKRVYYDWDWIELLFTFGPLGCLQFLLACGICSFVVILLAALFGQGGG